MIFETVKFSDITVNHDKKRIPLSTMERSKRQGSYRYYGAQGVIDYIDDYIFDGKYLLIAEDGENLKSKKQNIAQLAEGRFWVNNHAHIVQCNERCRLEYLCFMLNSMDLSGYITGSAQPKLSQANMNNISFEIPSVEMQDLILSVILPIEKRIATNTAINENLEQQAYLLLEQMLSIPHDDVCCLSDIANINPRYTLSKGTEARYIDMSQLSTTTSFPDGWTFRPYNGGMKFKNKDTIMARITPCLENGKTAYIDFLDGEEIAFGSTEYIVLSPKDNIPPELLYCIVRYPEFRTYATINMNGSSGRQRVSGEIIGKYEIPSFTQEELSEFGAVAEPLFKQITENSLQNRNLSALRDTLLPKLMNGEIDVSEVKI